MRCASSAEQTRSALTISRPGLCSGRFCSRLQAHPDVATLTEVGLADIDPGESWFGLFVTGGSPADIPARVQKDVAELFAAGEMRDKHIAARGLTPVFSTPEDFAGTIASESTRMERLIRLTGAKGEQ